MKFKIHKEGWPVIVLVFFLLAIIVVVINLISAKQTFIHVLLYLAGSIFYFFVVRFFADTRSFFTGAILVTFGSDFFCAGKVNFGSQRFTSGLCWGVAAAGVVWTC